MIKSGTVHSIIIGCLCIILLALFINISPVTIAQSNQHLINTSAKKILFTQGNTYYKNGNYEQAIVAYQQLVQSGLQDGNLYCNLGNAYYKMGKIGWAVLFYEKAKRLAPEDTSIRNNLEVALAEVNEGQINWLSESYHTLLFLASLDGLATMTSIMFFVFMILLCLRFFIYLNEHSRWIKHGCLGLLLIAGILFIFCLAVTVLTYMDRSQKQAVIIKPFVKIYYEPSDNGTVYFRLDEGTRIYILGTNHEWRLIKRYDGKSGWILKDNYQEI